MLKKTMVSKMVEMINKGSFVEEVAKEFEYSLGYVYKLLREHYPVKKSSYSKLLAKSREHKQKQVQVALSQPMSEEDNSSKQKEVIVTETGYMLVTGVNGILNESLDIYVPYFCLKELDKLSRSCQVAKELMTMHWTTNRVAPINLRGHEELYVDPTYPVKNRSRGVVATCVELVSKGFKVRLLTNSLEIEKLAKLQECDIDVIRITSASK